MKRGRSTGAPTKEEAARIVAVKEGPCMACQVLRESGRGACDVEGCDYHHLKSGNIRRGHMYGVGLCGWHHRRIPFNMASHKQMISLYGPSLLDGGKAFAEAFGSDEELLDRQNQLLGDEYE